MYDEDTSGIRSAKGSTMPDAVTPYSAIDALTSLNDTLDKQDRLLSELEGRTRFYRVSMPSATSDPTRDQDDNNSDLTNSLLNMRSRVRDHNETIQMILESLR